VINLMKNSNANQENYKIDGNLYNPPRYYDIPVSSVGYLTSTFNPFMWRAPMVLKAVQAVLYNCNWDDCEILLLDTPPGTGDIHLSLLQSYPIDGAFFITQPSFLSIKDSLKTVYMFHRMGVRVAGLIENMCSKINNINTINRLGFEPELNWMKNNIIASFLQNEEIVYCVNNQQDCYELLKKSFPEQYELLQKVVDKIANYV
jgi:MinD superfamily P-loop ATPase